jgi:hypothetical protein
LVCLVKEDNIGRQSHVVQSSSFFSFKETLEKIGDCICAAGMSEAAVHARAKNEGKLFFRDPACLSLLCLSPLSLSLSLSVCLSLLGAPSGKEQQKFAAFVSHFCPVDS